MGLFDFVKDAGDKLFQRGLDDAETSAAKADSLRGHVIGTGVEVRDLAISYDDGLATVRGVVNSQAEKEKVLLTVGNTYGVGKVDDQLSVEDPGPEAVFYTVQPGDSLSKIAKQQYGDAMKYPAIFEANRPMLNDPDKIYPGQVLRIPPLG